jgi:hypothetical protein
MWIGLSMEPRQMAMDLQRRESEGTLRVQNTLGGDIGSVEPCRRQHRQYGIMSEVM